MNKLKLIYFLLVVISILGILVAPYGIVNTMVSLKYETENIQDVFQMLAEKIFVIQSET